MGCILSFDVGTTGLKTIVISQEGRILKHCNIEYGTGAGRVCRTGSCCLVGCSSEKYADRFDRRNQEGAQGHRSLGTVSKPGNVGPEL